ncbi:hypothetical protein FRC16_002473 [Serendipita sp. 398]|nr:hypothetical protein FRC16_002473 [Serendipita sp. 398]
MTQRTQRTLELRAMRKELDYLTPSTTWTRFQNHVNEVEELEIKCADAKEAAKTSVNREEYWSSLRSITSWLDLRLPKEGMVPEDSQGAALNHLDLHYRLIVSNINAAKDHAFSFYVNNQDELRRYHQARFTAIQNIFYMLFKKSPQILSIRSVLQNYSDVLDTVSLSPTLDSMDENELRGPFSKTKYFNYLRDESECSPIFGSPIDSLSGTVGKCILEPSQVPLSAPLPILTAAVPSDGSIESCVRAVFDLEYLWEQRNPKFDPLETICRSNQHPYHASEGWLLGFLLVNLPAPILPVGDDVVRRHRNRMPRQSMGSLIKSSTDEHKFFHMLWRHTDDLNIKYAAEAITHAKGAERIVSDIRSKWDIGIERPLPRHRKWSSSDESSRKWNVLS